MSARTAPRVVGMLGGGQLGRMAALAAARLGLRVHIYTPEPDCPASQVTDLVTCAAWDDADALARFAASVDVITLEFENVPAATARLLAALKPVHPSPHALATCQDRLAEKTLIASLGLPAAPWIAAHSPADVADAMARLGPRAILKRARFGYDGKGQVELAPGSDPHHAWAMMGGEVGVVEGFVHFKHEISVILARAQDGTIAAYHPVENLHRDHILRQTISPARIAPALAQRASELATHIAHALDYVGVMGVELFITPDDAILINEIAPRPHNSGHWTLDAAHTCQFEQQLRAVCGLPLGSTASRGPATMDNLIGDDLDRVPALLADPTAHLHLYGKHPTRPGRKMGHVTFTTLPSEL